MRRKKLNRSKLPKWTKHLTAVDIWHLKDQDTFSLAKVKRQRDHNDKQTDNFGKCMECQSIINTLTLAGII